MHSKQSITLADEVRDRLQEIQKKRTRSAHRAIQVLLTRGAELAIAEYEGRIVALSEEQIASVSTAAARQNVPVEDFARKAIEEYLLSQNSVYNLPHIVPQAPTVSEDNIGSDEFLQGLRDDNEEIKRRSESVAQDEERHKNLRGKGKRRKRPGNK